MADDRMYMRCKGCGRMLFMGKTFSEGYNLWASSDAIQEFFDKHERCHWYYNLPPYQDFELVYESEERYDDFFYQNLEIQKEEEERY